MTRVSLVIMAALGGATVLDAAHQIDIDVGMLCLGCIVLGVAMGVALAFEVAR